MNPTPALPLIGEGAMDLAPLLSLAEESKADPAICHPSRFQSDPFARQGTTVHLPLVKGEAERGLPVWAKRGAGVQICSQVCTQAP